MDTQELKSIIEALIFVAEEPLSAGTITLILEEQGVTKKEIESAIDLIRKSHNEDLASGIQLVEVAGGYHFRTKPLMADWIQKLNVPKPVRLSQPAMETLAIVAYRQPIVRAEVEEIRGVDSGGVLKTLLERGLIKIIGKREEPGNPLVYATTKEFLELFNLKSLNEMPPLKSYEELEQMRVAGPFKGEATEPENSEILSDILNEEVKEFEGQNEWHKEDQSVLNELDSEMKRIRRLENDIFPKPVETMGMVLNPDAPPLDASVVLPEATASNEVSGEPNVPFESKPEAEAEVDPATASPSPETDRGSN